LKIETDIVETFIFQFVLVGICSFEPLSMVAVLVGVLKDIERCFGLMVSGEISVPRERSHKMFRY
jgi:hypothetical protein